MANSQGLYYSTSHSHLQQLIDFHSLKHFLLLPSRISLFIGCLPTLLAAPLLNPPHLSSPTLEFSPGPLPLSTHYLDDLIQPHGFNYHANADKPQNHVSNLTSSLTPDSLIHCLFNIPTWVFKKHF